MTKTTGLGCLGIAALLLGACGGGSAGPAGSVGPAGDAGANGAQGATGPQGPGTSAGEGGTSAASFSLIEPRVGLAGRELDVTVSVESASLNASSTIDFGDAKIVVSAIQVVSPTTLYAHLAIDPAATLGVHDVTITDGTTSLKGTGAFTVASEISVTINAGTAQQGGVFAADVHSNDTANFFDANSANPAATGNLYSFGASGITPNDLSAAFLVPPAGVVGNAQITVTNASGTAWASAPNAVTVTAQTPTALTLPYSQTAATIPAAASVYESAASPGIGILNYTIDVPSANSTFLPSGIVFPASGQIGDVVGSLAPVQGLFGPSPAPYHLIASIANTAATSMPTSLVLYDQAFATGAATAYNISVTNTVVSAVTVSKSTAHGTPALAQALTLPGIVTGTITAAGQIDAYKVTIPANAVFEFSLSGTGGAYAGVPADQTGLVLNSVTEGSGNDTTASGGSGPLVDTETFTQIAAPTTTTMYFVVAADPNLAALKTGTYTVTTRIVP